LDQSAPGIAAAKPLHDDIAARRDIALEDEGAESHVEAFGLELLRPEPDVDEMRDVSHLDQ
jgi:hypothetical protein